MMTIRDTIIDKRFVHGFQRLDPRAAVGVLQDLNLLQTSINCKLYNESPLYIFKSGGGIFDFPVTNPENHSF
jgi:hypothetical protein